MDSAKAVFGTLLVLMLAGVGFAHGIAFCPGANLTDSVREQFEEARADNDTATLKSLREEYCPAPDKPNASTIRGAKAHANSMIDRIRESMESGDYAGAKDLLENLRTLIRAFPPRNGPHGFGRPMAPPPGGFADNASVES